MNKKRKDKKQERGISVPGSLQTLGDSTSSLNSLANKQSRTSGLSNGSGGGTSLNSKRKASNHDLAASSGYGNGGGGGGQQVSKKAGGGGASMASGHIHHGGGDLSRLEKMIPTRFPLDHPYNKDGYRYHLVEPDPHSPMRQKFEETELWAGKPLPGHLYRVYLEPRCCWSLHDRAPQLKLSEDRMCVMGEKGYSMVRSTLGVSHGTWYFEVTVRDKPGESALRIGWAQKLANLQAPCGYDKFSYSWRSRKGTRFHDSIGKTYSKLVETNDESKAGYGQDDVLGFYIHLPVEDPTQILPDSCKNLTLVKFKNHLYYEEKDHFTAEEKKLVPHKNSKIVFYKNGVSQGVAYTDIYKGVYYPAISVYKSASAVVNFGPNFKYPIGDDPSVKPISSLVDERFVEQTLSDLVYHVAHQDNYNLEE